MVQLSAVESAEQAAAVTLPAAATPPAGREHLPLDEALISAVLPPQHARVHPLHAGKGAGAA